jgi:hypothetical protein
VAGTIAGALPRASGRLSRDRRHERDDSLVRLLVVSKATAERVRGWLDSGISFGDALLRLNGKQGAS